MPIRCNVASLSNKLLGTSQSSFWVLTLVLSLSSITCNNNNINGTHVSHRTLSSELRRPHSPLLNHTAAFILDIVSHRPAGGRGWIHTNFVDVSLYVEWVGGGSGTAMRHDRASLRDIRGRQLLGTKQWRFHSDKKQKLDKCKHRDV